MSATRRFVCIFSLLALTVLLCFADALSASAPPTQISLEESVTQADLVVVGKIAYVDWTMDGNYEVCVGAVEVSEVLAGNANLKEVKIAWPTGVYIDPSTKKRINVASSTRVSYTKGQEGIWVLKAHRYNRKWHQVALASCPIEATEANVKEIREYIAKKRPFEYKTSPAVPVNGLLAEIKILNAPPLRPGDEIEIEFRLTNVGENGRIQIVDAGAAPNEFCRPVLVGPDGKVISIPLRPVEPSASTKEVPSAKAGAVSPDAKPLTAPRFPAASLEPGCFYGKTVKIRPAASLAPGKYSLVVEYKNSLDLADQGFACWKGKARSNTIVFDIAP
jgi:hypothetical protein